ncbi:MAG: FmdE family protein [Methanobrevibacter sp.]|uniref:FmdE family protein n=1 Tax=Methanobrevibacter sp. TaxID=66852 RepID=UPI003F03DF0D
MNIDDYDEQLKKAVEFHGELCGGIAIGTKLGMYGLELLGMELNKRHKNLIVILESERCTSDGIQAVTKCSIGKRSLKLAYYGKFAATFYNMDTGEAYRVSDADANKKDKSKETREELVERFRITPPEELFNVEKVKVKQFNEAQKPGGVHATSWCSVCGEKITDNYHLLRAGKPICEACANESYYEVIE